LLLPLGQARRTSHLQTVRFRAPTTCLVQEITPHRQRQLTIQRREPMCLGRPMYRMARPQATHRLELAQKVRPIPACRVRQVPISRQVLHTAISPQQKLHRMQETRLSPKQRLLLEGCIRAKMKLVRSKHPVQNQLLVRHLSRERTNLGASNSGKLATKLN